MQASPVRPANDAAPDPALHRPGGTTALQGAPGTANPPAGRVQQALRLATMAAHHALDHHPLMPRLTRSDLSRGQYAESLAAMYRPHLQLERQVHASRHHSESGLTLSPRRDLLEADLSELGWPVPPLPNLPPDPLETRAAWWGRVYVLEGSRQGGAFMARNVRSALGDTVPCRFFGEVRGPDEHSALQAMRERELDDPDALELAAASACAAFAAYQAGLDAFVCGSTAPRRARGK